MQPIDEVGHNKVANSLPSKDQLFSELWVFIDEMKTAEQLAVPTLRWDPVSTDKKEVLAVLRIGVLISTYEPQYYWFVPFCFAAWKYSIFTLIPVLTNLK